MAGEDELDELFYGCNDDQDRVVVLLAEVDRLRKQSAVAQESVSAAMREMKRDVVLWLMCFTFATVTWGVCYALMRSAWALPVAWAIDAVGGWCVIGPLWSWLYDRKETGDA